MPVATRRNPSDTVERALQDDLPARRRFMARVARAGRFFCFGLAFYLLSYLYI